MELLDQLNADQGNLDLEDTRDLINILDLLDSNRIMEAKELLDEFIVRRGYDETAADLLNGGN